MRADDQIDITGEFWTTALVAVVPMLALALATMSLAPGWPITWLLLVFDALLGATPGALIVFCVRRPARLAVWIARAVVTAGSYLVVTLSTLGAVVREEAFSNRFVLVALFGVGAWTVMMTSWVIGCVRARRVQLRHQPLALEREPAELSLEQAQQAATARVAAADTVQD